MADPFASAKRRLARANEHIESIDRAIAAFFETKPYANIRETNARGMDEIKVRLTADIPDDITILTVETVEHLRASLDYVMAPICAKVGIGPADKIHFPIVDTADRLENTLTNGRFKNLPPDIKTRLRQIKPYEGGNEVLWALNRVRRQTAHRFLAAIGTIVIDQGKRFSGNDPYPFTVHAPKWDWEKNEVVLATTSPHAKFDYEFKLSFTIAFGDVEVVRGFELLAVLADMAALVDKIIKAIDETCTRIGLFV